MYAVKKPVSSRCPQLPRKLPKRKSRFKRSDGSTSSDTTSSFIKRQVKASARGGEQVFPTFSLVSSKNVFVSRLANCLLYFAHLPDPAPGVFSSGSSVGPGAVPPLSGRGQRVVWERWNVARKSHHSPVFFSFFVITVFRSRLRWRFGCYLRCSVVLRLPWRCLITASSFFTSLRTFCCAAELMDHLQEERTQVVSHPGSVCPKGSRASQAPIRHILTNPGLNLVKRC